MEGAYKPNVARAVQRIERRSDAGKRGARTWRSATRILSGPVHFARGLAALGYGKDAIADIAANDQALWLLVPYGVSGPGGKEVPVTVIGEYLRKNLSIPTLGIISVHTKIGVLVAISVSPYDLGGAVAEQVARSLNGEEQRAIGVYPLRKSRLEINLQEAERLNIAIPEKLKGIATIVNLRDLPMQR